jgi:hypothetical protein
VIRVYDENVDSIAGGTTPHSVAEFQPSQPAKDRVADLTHKEKTTGLTAVEAVELHHFMQLEHSMRLTRLRARTICSQSPALSLLTPPAHRTTVLAHRTTVPAIAANTA